MGSGVPRERLNPLRLLRNRFVRDSAVLQVGALFNAGGNFFTAVALSHLLGARGQGSFYVAVSLYSFLWFSLNLGLVSVTVSQVAAAHARGLSGKAAAWLAYLAKVYLLLGVATAGLAFLLLPSIAEHALGTERAVGLLAALMAFSPLLELPRVVLGASLQASRRMLALTRIENGQESMRVFLVVTGAVVTGDAAGAVIGTLVASALGSWLAVEIYARERTLAPDLLPATREVLAHVRDVPIRQGLPLGLRMGAVQNLMAMATQILPTLLVQRFGTTEWVAYVRIAQRIMNVPSMFMQGISRTTLPVFSQYAGQKDLLRMCRAYFRASLYSGLLISTGILCSLPFLPWVIARAFPPDYHEPVWHVCRILVPGFMLMSFAIANDTFYLVTDTLRVGILLSIAGTLVNTLVIFLLTSNYPTVGVAWGLDFTMSLALMHNVYAWIWYRRHRQELLARAGESSPAVS